MRFLPREEKFFHYFRQQVAVIREAVSALQTAFHQPSPDFGAVAEKLAELEHKGDTVLHDVFDKLNQTFITPIDPEDIQALASLLDEVLDYIEDAGFRIAAFEIPEITPELQELVRVLADCGAAMDQAIDALEHQRPLIQHCIEINRLESEADQLERRAVSALFRNEKDPIRLLKYKEIYETLERATDACEDVADRLQNVVVKNS